jgi:hypothetical protein
MAFPRRLGDLCSPAQFYFIISVIGVISMIAQNLGSENVFSLGYFSTIVPSTTLLFLLKFGYILFWTWVLNLICKDGQKGIAWLLVLVPFILMFVLLGLVLLA